VTTDQINGIARGATTRQALSKVPEVTAYFWITKVLTTGMGEAASDFLTRVFGNVPAVGLGALALAGALLLQFRTPRYTAWVYWTAVVMVSVFGTMAADVLHVGLGVPYGVSTPFFLVVLIAVFLVWNKSEKTLSIHSIHTPRREFFYWLTVMTTFALGTAAGDLTAVTLKLGYFSSGVMFAVVIAVPALAHRRFGLGAIPAFWLAYIVTRPLGASFADWMALSRARGGLNMGLGPVTLAWSVAILGFVAYLAVTRQDVQTAQEEIDPLAVTADPWRPPDPDLASGY
jgi:uncharacterized membrane-anchored protein